MRMSKRSFGACAFACLALPLGWLGCAREGTSSTSETGSAHQALADSRVTVPWTELGFVRGGDESRDRGPSAVAFAADGKSLLVLDTLALRIVSVTPNGAVRSFATELPKDADGIAVSPQGEVAVHRALTLSVDVYDARGQRSGSVAVPPGARDANVVHLLSQGRVVLEHPYQERYLLGSPNAPRDAQSVLASRREGVAEGFAREGYQILVEHPDGQRVVDADPGVARLGAGPARAGSHAYLMKVSPEGEAQGGSFRYAAKRVMDLGEAASGRLFGVVGSRACSVLEHVDLESTQVHVQREVVCASADAGKELTRFPVETSALYTPHHELAFDGKRVVQALPTEAGLTLRTVAVTEVSK